MTTETKTCTACKQELPLSEFRYRKGRDAYVTQCRPCERKKNREQSRGKSRTRTDADRERERQWRAKNKDKVQAQQVKQRVRLWLLELVEVSARFTELKRRRHAARYGKHTYATGWDLYAERAYEKAKRRLDEIPQNLKQHLGDQAEARMSVAMEAYNQVLAHVRKQYEKPAAHAARRVAEAQARRAALPDSMPAPEKELRAWYPDGLAFCTPPLPLPDHPYDPDDPAWGEITWILSALRAAGRAERKAHLKAAAKKREVTTSEAADIATRWADAFDMRASDWGSGW